MQKKLIALAVASILAAPLAAQAGVEIYGQARVSMDYNNNGDDNTGMEKSSMSVSSNASRLGFRGDEDLGGGLKALWQFEQGVGFDTSTFGKDPRPSFVGLAGGFGTVLAGKMDTPYQTATNKWDPFVDTKADYNALMGGDVRASNTVAYVTPNFSGFTGAAAWIAGSTSTGTPPAAKDDLPLTKLEKEQNAFSLSGNFTQGPFAVVAAYEVLNKRGDTRTTPLPAATEPSNDTSWKIGGAFTLMNATTLALIYENRDVGGDIKDRNNIHFNAAHKLGGTTLKFAVTKAGECGGAAAFCDKTGATQISLGAAHALSKTTEVYALYSQISNQDNAGYGLAGGPGAVTKVSGVSSDPSVFSVGINHAFSSK